MVLIIALAFFESIDIAVLTFLLALVIWYGSLFALYYADSDDEDIAIELGISICKIEDELQ